jgi:hypothetical protein
LVCRTPLCDDLIHGAGPYVPTQLASSFSVNTLSGTPYVYDLETLTGAPLLVLALNDSDPFTRYTATNTDSIDEWLLKMPNNTQFLFFSYDPPAKSGDVIS